MAEVHSETNISNDKPSNDAVSSFSAQETETSEAIGLPSDGARLLRRCRRLLSTLPPEGACPPPERPADLLAAALFLLMADGGFAPSGEVAGSGEPRLPADWKTARPGTYSAEFTLPHFPDYSCRLVANPLGDFMLVNCVSSESVSAYSACLSTRRYLPQEDGSPPEMTRCGELFLEIKDSVVSPTRSAALSVRGIANASLTGLPKELLVRILLLLKPRDVCRVSATCRLLKTVARDQIIWQHFYNRKYPKSKPSGIDLNSLDWFHLFKENHEEQVSLRKTMTGFLMQKNVNYFPALSWVGEFLKEI